MRVKLKHRRLALELAKSSLTLNRWAQRMGLSSGHLSDLVNGRRVRRCRPGAPTSRQEVHPHHQRTLGLEAGVDRGEPREALDHQPGAGQQGQRERHLGHHQRAAQTAGSPGSSPAARTQRALGAAPERQPVDGADALGVFEIAVRRMTLREE